MAQEINELVEPMNAHDLDAIVRLFHRDYHSEQVAGIGEWAAKSRLAHRERCANAAVNAALQPFPTGGRGRETTALDLSTGRRSRAW